MRVLVVPRGDAPIVFDAVEITLDQIPMTVKLMIVEARDQALGVRRDDGLRAV